MVGTGASLTLKIGFEFQLVVERVRPRSVQRGLREGQGARRSRGQPSSDRLGLGHDPVIGHHPSHEPESLRVGCRQGLAEQGEFGRLRAADQPRQQPGGARIGHESDSPEGQQEARALGRDPDVAGERERGPGAGRDPVDGGDDRLR